MIIRMDAPKLIIQRIKSRLDFVTDTQFSTAAKYHRREDVERIHSHRAFRVAPSRPSRKSSGEREITVGVVALTYAFLRVVFQRAATARAEFRN